MNRPFIKGLDLSQRFYEQAVRPVLSSRFPTLVHSAASIGQGSDVLGLDTPQSMDHDWGPKLQLFLTEAGLERVGEAVDRALRQDLPPDIKGYPTNFGRHKDGSRVMAAASSGSIQHEVAIHATRPFFSDILNFDPTGPIEAIDWLSAPENHLLMLTAGRVFHDGLGQLEPLRARLHYYPHDVWLYLLAVQWRRIAQEEAFVGRCGQVGDELGSSLVAARLVRDLMRLCFLMERQYAPYIKWLGTAFARLACAAELAPLFGRVLAARHWQERQEHLSAAYEYAARMHNDLGITPSLPAEVAQFHNRPFWVIHGDRYVDAIRAQIESEGVLALPLHLGSVDQFTDSTDVLNHLARIKMVF